MDKNTKMSNPGAELAAKRKKVEKVCPVCGNPYIGLPTSMACPTHAKSAAQQRWRLKKKLKQSTQEQK
jgi:predicted RNA-binding Zn-ribbon protein involved in translation (DUF1610 family)